jgi:hypothetical protein
MFGPEETKAHLEPKPPAAGGGAFTRMFESQGAPAPPANNPGIIGTPAPAAAIPAAPAPAFPPMASAPSANAPGSPATRFFKGADAVAAPKAPVIPAGPSEYTRVVKFSEVMKEANAATPGVPPVPGSAPGMGVPPAMPAYPQMPGVPAYQPPQVAMPQYAPPQMPMPGQPYGVPGVVPPAMPQYPPPQFQAPPLPTQKLPAMAQPKSWMPLVILFLGLTVVALLIVLLFALKGH